jgi:hypothetical protein
MADLREVIAEDQERSWRQRSRDPLAPSGEFIEATHRATAWSWAAADQEFRHPFHDDPRDLSVRAVIR